MPDFEKSYSVGNKRYTIPEKDTTNFLSDFPDAQEIKIFSSQGKKYSIPEPEVDMFKMDMPDAKPEFNYNFITPENSNGADTITAPGYILQEITPTNALYSPQQEAVFASNRGRPQDYMPKQQSKFTAEDINQAKVLRPQVTEMWKEADKAFSEKYAAKNNLPLLSMFGGLSPGETFRDEYSTTEGNLKHTLKTTEKLLELVEKGDRNGVSRFIGGLTTLDVMDLLTAGTKKMTQQIDLYGSAKRYRDGTATLEDKNLLIAEAIKEQAQGLAQKDRATSIGTGLSDMAPWLAQFALTGGVGASAGLGTAKALTTLFAEKALPKIVQTILRGGSKFVGGVVGSAAQSLAQVPIILGGTAERMTDTYDVNLNLQKKGEGMAKAFRKTYINNILETYSERVFGTGMDRVLGKLSKSVGKRMDGSKVSDIINAVRNNRWVKVTNKTLGINTPLTEFTEEIFAGVTQPYVTNDNLADANKEVARWFEKENMIRTFLTVSAMGAGMGSVQAPGMIYNNIRSNQGLSLVNNFNPTQASLWSAVVNQNSVISQQSGAFAHLLQNMQTGGATPAQLNSLGHYYNTFIQQRSQQNSQAGGKPVYGINDQYTRSKDEFTALLDASLKDGKIPYVSVFNDDQTLADTDQLIKRKHYRTIETEKFHNDTKDELNYITHPTGNVVQAQRNDGKNTPVFIVGGDMSQSGRQLFIVNANEIADPLLPNKTVEKHIIDAKDLVPDSISSVTADEYFNVTTKQHNDEWDAVEGHIQQKKAVEQAAKIIVDNTIKVGTKVNTPEGKGIVQKIEGKNISVGFEEEGVDPKEWKFKNYKQEHLQIIPNETPTTRVAGDTATQDPGTADNTQQEDTIDIGLGDEAEPTGIITNPDGTKRLDKDFKSKKDADTVATRLNEGFEGEDEVTAEVVKTKVGTGTISNYVWNIVFTPVSIDDAILAAQKRLGITEVPPVNISDNTELTLAKIEAGEPVTNEFIKQASDELYQNYKMLEVMKSNKNRAFTIEQIESMQEYLGEEITNLENHANQQTEEGAFVNKNETGHAAQDGATKDTEQVSETVNNSETTVENVPEIKPQEPIVQTDTNIQNDNSSQKLQEVRDEYLRADLERELDNADVPPVGMNELRSRFGLTESDGSQQANWVNKLIDETEAAIRKKLGKTYPSLKQSTKPSKPTSKPVEIAPVLDEADPITQSLQEHGYEAVSYKDSQGNDKVKIVNTTKQNSILSTGKTLQEAYDKAKLLKPELFHGTTKTEVAGAGTADQQTGGKGTAEGDTGTEGEGKTAEGTREVNPQVDLTIGTNAEESIVNPIDRNMSQDDKVVALQKLSEVNAPVINALLKEMDAELGTESKSSFKEPEKIKGKANRPSILKTKPWFNVEHIRDSFRFKTVITDLSQIGDIILKLHSEGYEIVKPDLDKLFNPKEWGWRFVAFDLRMPNGQLIEYYSPLRGQEEAKKAGNHALFEKWRSLDTEKFDDKKRDEYGLDVKKSWDKYQAAWEDYLKSKGQTESEALASFRILIDRVSSRTRSKLSLRSSAVKQPLDQAPSTFIADNTPGSQTNNLPSDKSSEAKPLNSPISNILVPANIQNNTDETKPIDANNNVLQLKTKQDGKQPEKELIPDTIPIPNPLDFVPPNDWRGHLIKSRVYAKGILTPEELNQAKTEGMDWSDQKSIEKAIDKKLGNIKKEEVPMLNGKNAEGLLDELTQNLKLGDTPQRNIIKFLITNKENLNSLSKQVFDTWIAEHQSHVDELFGKNPSAPKEIDVNSLLGSIKRDGEAKLSDHVKKEQPKYGEDNKFITESRYEELKRKMREKGNNLNSGFDPEMFAMGAEMAAYHIEAGGRRFADFAKRMVKDLGEWVKPYLASYYEGARRFPEMKVYKNELDTTDFVDNYEFSKEIPEQKNNSDKNDVTSGKKNNLNTEDNGSNSNTERSAGNSKNGVDAGQSSGTSVGNIQPGGAIGEGATKSNQTSEDIASNINPAGKSGQIPDTGNGAEHSLSGRGIGAEGNGEPNIGKVVSGHDRITGLTPEQQNHVIKPEDSIVPNGETAKIRANIKAIKLAKTLEKKNKNATPAEKKVLAQYVGWGGLAPVFKNTSWDDAWKTKYGDFAKELKELITPEEWRAAKESTINAHYTDRNVIDAMWKMVERMGFKGGRILEPAGGVGHFFGLMPESISKQSQLRGVELDKISGLIFSKLYPQARIDVSGFEEMHDANNSYDLTISNVPFAGIHVYDSLNKDISKDFTLHNYFIAKSIRLLKPGGIGAFITTSATMDNEGQGAKFRAWVNSPEGGNADLIDAIRLPNNAFKENAGTEVTTDILFFRKRNGSTKHAQAKNFLVNGDYGQAKGKDREDNSQYWNKKIIPGETITIRVNEFYLDHPDRMLGEMRLAHEVGAGGLYSPDMPTLHAPKGLNVAKRLNEIAETMPKDIFEAKPIEEKPTAYAEEGQSEGELITKDGKPYIVSYGELVSPDWNENQVTGSDGKTKYTKAQVVDRYNEIKKVLKSLIIAESKAESTDEEIEKIRKQLNTKYDKYNKDFGDIYENRKTQFLRDDVDYSLVSSLENTEQVAVKDEKGIERFEIGVTKVDIFTKRMNQPREEPKTAGNIDDALDISFAYRNELDVDYMASLTGIDAETIKQDLLQRELAYENPLTGIIEDKDSYLSGYVRKKLKQAESAAQKDSKYKTNVEALRKVIPNDIPLLQIQTQLGASWINPKVVQNWIKNLIELDVPAFYNKVTDRWSLSVPWQAQHNVKNQNEHSAGGESALDLVLAALNQQLVTVYDKVPNGNGGYNQVKNEANTAAAQGKVKELKNMFQEAVWDLKGEDATSIIRSYNDLHNAWVNKTVSVSENFTTFPGANKDIKLRKHAIIGIKKGLAGATMLAHQVGTGKTFQLITIAMEMKRLGLAKKPMIVVQKATTSQFAASFRALYPGAKILIPSKKDLEASERKKLFAKIALNEWDAVIIYHDFLTKIPDKPDRQIAYINERIDELEQVSSDEEVPAFGKTDNQKAIEKLKEELVDIQKRDEEYRNPTVKDQAKKAISTRTKLQRQFDRKTDKVLYFEDMGVDALLVDEAHTFKRLGLSTKGGAVKGIDTSGSQKSVSAKLKTRYILENNNQKNVIFATGTPISNTMAEAYTMMNYLIPERLKDHGIKTFDDFRTTFGSVDPSLEFTAAGKFKFVDRFAKYINLPELQRLWQSVADVVLTEEIAELKAGVGTPELKDGKPTNHFLKMTQALENKMKEFKETLERWDKLPGKEKRDLRHIPLVVFNLAKRAAIDVRLVDSKAPDDPGSKTNKVVTEVKRLYDESKDYKGTQLVFSDMIESSDGAFNLHQDIKNKLIKKYGIPESEVQIISDHDTDAKREKLFEKINSGEVRVVIGSTDKLGIGVNVQERLKAVHHIDAPARPMDFEQRNGRVVRQGNIHLNMGIPVEIVTYGVEKTLDATAYQRLFIKQKFIHQMMKKGISIDRVLEEEDEDMVGGNFAQIMANLSGSQYAILHISESLKLQQAEMDKRNFQRKQIEAQEQKRQNEYSIEGEKRRIEEAKENIQFFKENLPVHEITSIQFGKTGKVITKDILEYIDEVKSEVSTEHTKYVIINGKIQGAIKFSKVFVVDGKNLSEMELLAKTNAIEPFNLSGSGWRTNTYKTAHGLFKKAFETVTELQTEEPERNHRIAKYKSDNITLDKILSEKYPKQDKLDQLKARVAELEVKMQEETSGITASMPKDVKTDDLTSIKEVAAIPGLNLPIDQAEFLYKNQNGIESKSPKIEDIKVGDKLLYDYDDSIVEVVEVNTEDREVKVKGDDGQTFGLNPGDLRNEYQLRPLVDKGFIDGNYYQLTDKGQRFIDLVNKRKHTRMFANLGIDLFPETTNIPEITGKVVDYKGVSFSRLSDDTQSYSDDIEQATTQAQPVIDQINNAAGYQDDIVFMDGSEVIKDLEKRKVVTNNIADIADNNWNAVTIKGKIYLNPRITTNLKRIPQVLMHEKTHTYFEERFYTDQMRIDKFEKAYTELGEAEIHKGLPDPFYWKLSKSRQAEEYVAHKIEALTELMQRETGKTPEQLLQQVLDTVPNESVKKLILATLNNIIDLKTLQDAIDTNNQRHSDLRGQQSAQKGQRKSDSNGSHGSGLDTRATGDVLPGGERVGQEQANFTRQKEVNEQFNQELQQFKLGTLKGNLHLGEPESILKSAGINANEITLNKEVLAERIKKHEFTIEDIKDLAEAIQEPIMVYEWGTKAKSIIVVTNITHGDNKITVAIKLERQGKQLLVNEIASVHGKSANRFLSEMENSKEGGLKDALRYVEKEKALDWLGIAPPKGAASETNKGLSSTAKIIQEFENPTLPDKNISSENNLSDSDVSLVNEKKRTYKTKEGEAIQYDLFSDIDNGAGTDGTLQRKNIRDKNPSLRKLTPGEHCAVEMKYTADKNFVFDGSNKIQSPEDIAYLFRKLEDKSVENMFACLVKDGKPTIIHLSMGGRAGTVVDFGVLADGISRFNPDKVWLLHNHPSGNLGVSDADYNIHRKAIQIWGEDLIQEHVIINVKSGKYATFKEGHYDHSIQDHSEKILNPKKYKVIKFDKQVFKQSTVLPIKITGSSAIAQFVSAQKYTDGDKLSVLILSRNLEIKAYLHLSSVDFNNKSSVDGLIKELLAYGGRFGGMRTILVGNMDVNSAKSALFTIRDVLEKAEMQLDDVLSVRSAYNYDSMADNGVLEPSPAYVQSEVNDPIFSIKSKPAQKNFPSWDDYFTSAKAWQEDKATFSLTPPKIEDFARQTASGSVIMNDPATMAKLDAARKEYLNYKKEWKKNPPLSAMILDSWAKRTNQTVHNPTRGTEILIDRMKKRGGVITEESDPVREYYNAVGRKIHRTEMLNKHEIKGFKDAAAAFVQHDKLTADQFNEYMQAKHAPERNRVLRGVYAAKAEELHTAVKKKADQQTDQAQLLFNAGSITQAEYDTKLKEINKTVEDSRKRTDKRIAKINNTVYSGMTDAEAQALTDKYEANVPVSVRDAFWEAKKKLSDKTIDLAVEYERITPLKGDELKAMYEHYIPLRGWQEPHGEGYDFFGEDIGAGFSNPFKTAQGRESLAADPAGYLLKDAESMISSGENNRVKQAFLNLVRANTDIIGDKITYGYAYEEAVEKTDQNGDPYTEWQIMPDGTVPDKAKIASGEARLSRDAKKILAATSDQAKELTVMVWEGGRPVKMVFNEIDPVIARFLNRKIDPAVDKWNHIVSAKVPEAVPLLGGLSVGGVNRTMGMLLTSANPYFFPMNYSGDVLTMLASEFVTGSAKDAFQSFGNLPNAHLQMSRFQRGVPNNNTDLKYAYEYYDSGSAYGFRQMNTIEEHNKSFADFIKESVHGKRIDIRTKHGAQAIHHGIMAISEHFEQSVRLAVYIHWRKSGKSIIDAGQRAEETTINFKMRGTAAPFLNGMWMFTSVGLEATSKFMRWFGKNPKQTLKATSVFVMPVILGFIANMLLQAVMGGDDDKDKDGLTRYDKLSPYLRKNFICIPSGDHVVTIKIPPLLRKFWGLGMVGYDVYRHQMTNGAEGSPPQALLTQMAEIATDISIVNITNFVNSKGDFNAGSFFYPFMPTAGKPFYELGANISFTGGRKYPEQVTFNEATEKAQAKMHFRNTNKLIVKGTDLMYDAMGGNSAGDAVVMNKITGKPEHIPSINPAWIESIVQGYGGGYGKIGLWAADLAYSAFQTPDDKQKEQQKDLIKRTEFNFPVASVFYRGLNYDPLTEKYWDAVKNLKETKYGLDAFRKVRDMESWGPLRNKLQGEMYDYDAQVSRLKDLEERTLREQSNEEAEANNALKREFMYKIIQINKTVEQIQNKKP